MSAPILELHGVWKSHAAVLVSLEWQQGSSKRCWVPPRQEIRGQEYAVLAEALESVARVLRCTLVVHPLGPAPLRGLEKAALRQASPYRSEAPTKPATEPANRRRGLDPVLLALQLEDASHAP